MRILIIDDEANIREMISTMLASEEYELLNAENGLEGLKILRKNSDVDIVITDIIMPEKEGLETIREIKKDFPRIKILAISGGGKIDPSMYLHIAKSMGAEDTLGKPFVKRDLLAALEKLSD